MQRSASPSLLDLESWFVPWDPDGTESRGSLSSSSLSSPIALAVGLVKLQVLRIMRRRGLKDDHTLNDCHLYNPVTTGEIDAAKMRVYEIYLGLLNNRRKAAAATALLDKPPLRV